MSNPELYGVSVRGPDDLIACRNYPEAVEVASALNADFAEHVRSAHHPFDPLMWASPVVWPHNSTLHAADLANPSPDYVALLERIRANPLNPKQEDEL